MKQIIQFQQNTIRNRILLLSLFMAGGQLLFWGGIFLKEELIVKWFMLIIGLLCTLNYGKEFKTCMQFYRKKQKLIEFTPTHLIHNEKSISYKNIKGTTWMYDTLYLHFKDGRDDHIIKTHSLLNCEQMDKLRRSLIFYIKG